MFKKHVFVGTCIVATGLAVFSVVNMVSVFLPKSNDNPNASGSISPDNLYEPMKENASNLVMPEPTPADGSLNEAEVKPVFIKNHSYSLKITNMSRITDQITMVGDHSKIIGEAIYSELYPYMKGNLNLDVKDGSVYNEDGSIYFILTDTDTNKDMLKTYYNPDAEITGQSELL